MKKLIVKIIIICFLSQNSSAIEIKGFANVVDGDTITINKKKIRLEGIDAPEMRQTCKKPFLKISVIIGFTFNKRYNCGINAKAKLENIINNQIIICKSSKKDKYKRYLAICFKEKTDLNGWMVRNGHAVAYKRYSKKYINEELYAKENKLGLWSGSFLQPEKWRKLN